jgi:hypothetical protein
VRRELVSSAEGEADKLINKGRLDDAITFLEPLTAVEPALKKPLCSCYRRRANSYLENSHYELVRRDCNRALELLPGDMLVMQTLGIACNNEAIAKGNTPEGHQLLEKALQLFPQNDTIRENLVDWMRKLLQLPQAQRGVNSAEIARMLSLVARLQRPDLNLDPLAQLARNATEPQIAEFCTQAAAGDQFLKQILELFARAQFELRNRRNT